MDVGIPIAVTDSATLQLTMAGFPTGEILVARRYSHIPIEVVSLPDMVHAANFLSAVVTRIDEKWVGGLEERIK